MINEYHILKLDLPMAINDITYPVARARGIHSSYSCIGDKPIIYFTVHVFDEHTGCKSVVVQYDRECPGFDIRLLPEDKVYYSFSGDNININNIFEENIAYVNRIREAAVRARNRSERLRFMEEHYD